MKAANRVIHHPPFMQIADQINRVRVDPDALDFNTLRKDAITLVQDLCGKTWTDYNLHDPGVTILEQLCYALTDLSYRSGFSVEDYLTNKDGVIDYEAQALHPPHEILSSSAVTETDYQKVLYDSTPEVDHIWLMPFSLNGIQVSGLYTVYVKIDENLLQTWTGADPEPFKTEKTVERIMRLLDNLHRLQKVTIQIKESLQTRQNMLIRWRNHIEQSPQKRSTAQFAMIERLTDHSRDIFPRLDRQLFSLSYVLEELESIHTILLNQACDPKGVHQVNEWLTKLEQLFNVPLFIIEFDKIFSILDIPLKKLSDLISVLKSVLPRLKAVLAQADVLFKDMASNLKAARKHLLSFYEAKVKQKILTGFSADRNICEDIQSIRIVETKPFFLVGKIEIKPSHSPAKVYAEIFFKCSRYISSKIQIDHYGTIIANNKDYEQVFSGPLTRHGYVRDEFFNAAQHTLTVMDLITLIKGIEGVVRIQNLVLMDEDGQQHSSLSDQLSMLLFPELHFSAIEKSEQALLLNLPHGQNTRMDHFSIIENGGKTDTLFFEEVQRELKKLIFEYHAFRKNKQPFTQFITLPKGQQRNFNHYYSIQNQFPAIYGINKYGIPRSKPPEIHAKAKQLKAYLFPFEQLMANYVQGLQEIPNVFSISQRLKKTYFAQFLDNDKIPDIEALYTDSNTDRSALIDEILAQHDEYGTRRNQILDILLALYGESLDYQKLQYFNVYRKEDADEWMIEIKINYLKTIREATRDRAKGFDYLQATPAALHQDKPAELVEPVTGLHLKISFLLGLSHSHKTEWLTDVLVKKKSCLVSDELLARKIKFLSAAQHSDAVRMMPGFCPKNDSKIAVPDQLPVLSDTIFKYGHVLANYRLVRTEQGETVVCFKPEHDSRLWVLTQKASFEEAACYAHQFCGIIRQLNMACEQFYVVEHLLLRPRGEHANSSLLSNAVFFCNRASILLPAWTARFSDFEFRKFAEETIQKNLPAHVFVDFYWLDFKTMQDFENSYKNWLQALKQLKQNDNDSSLPQINQASESIISLLKAYQQEGKREYWL